MELRESVKFVLPEGLRTKRRMALGLLGAGVLAISVAGCGDGGVTDGCEDAQIVVIDTEGTSCFFGDPNDTTINQPTE